jgi:hypothetical protein
LAAIRAFCVSDSVPSSTMTSYSCVASNGEGEGMRHAIK